MSRRKTHEEFMVDFEKHGNKNVIVLGRYINAKTKILVKCKVDGYEWCACPSDLLQGGGCPVCFGRVVVEGINDLATLRPDLIKYFADPKDATKVTVCSNRVANLKCPDCGSPKNMIIKDLTTRSFSCQTCSDGISFPNKFSRALLKQLPVEDVVYEYNPDWLKPYLYDNYFRYQNREYVLEMDGGIGHGNKQWHTQEKDIEGYKRDQIKDALAAEHNICVIRIDCVKSEKDYIVYNILQSELSCIFDLSNVDWNECERYAVKNVVKLVCNDYNSNQDGLMIEIANKYGISKTTMRKYLTIGSRFGWCEYSVEKSINDRNSRLSKKINVFSADQEFISQYSSTKECARKLTELYGVKYYDINILRAAKSGKPYHNLYFQYA